MSLSRYRAFPTIFKYGGPSPTVRQRCRRATEHTQRSASIFSVRSSRLGAGGTAATWSWGAGVVSLAAVMAMLLARTSSTSRVLSDRGCAEGVCPWACASVPVRSEFIQIHTDGRQFFLSPIGNGGTFAGARWSCCFQPREDIQRGMLNRMTCLYLATPTVSKYPWAIDTKWRRVAAITGPSALTDSRVCTGPTNAVDNTKLIRGG